MPIDSILAEISLHIEASKGAASEAETMLWNLVHTKSETLQDDGTRDLTYIARNLSAAGRQMEDYIETVGKVLSRRTKT